MAYVTPIGQLWLLKDIPWSKNYQHTAYFSDASSQHSFICHSDHVIGTANPKTAQNYIKDPLSGTIKVEGHSYTYRNCNYICWANTDIKESLEGNHIRETKYYYAFADEIRYVNNSVFEIDYTVDVLQTFLFGGGSCSLKKCFIERTHTQTDTFGEHIEPEPVTSDRYVFDHVHYSDFYDADPSKWAVLVYASKSRAEGDNIKTMGMRCGLPQGVYCNVFKPDDQEDAYKKFADWFNAHTTTDESYADWASKIVAVVAVPDEFVSASSGGLADNPAWNSSKYIDTYTSQIDGFTPKNKKLLTYPYNCMYLSTQDGTNTDLPYEFMSINNDKARFKCAIAIQPQPELIVAPYGYKGYPQGNVDYDAKVVVKDFPMIPWVGDAYKQYLGSQGMQNAFNLVKGAVGGLASGSLTGVGAIPGAVMGTLGTAIQQDIRGEQVKMGADNPHVSSNSTLWALGQKTVMSAQKCVCETDAKRIDNFFTTYGYAIKTTDTVHFTNPRYNQHYVKTANCDCKGGAPSKAIAEIENIFNRGITIWNSGDNVGSYTGLW